MDANKDCECGRLANKRARAAEDGGRWSNISEPYGDAQWCSRPQNDGHRDSCGTKRPATEDEEIDKICDLATKRMRLQETQPSSSDTTNMQGDIRSSAQITNLNYQEMNQQLKEAHFHYLMQRQQRGLPPLKPQDCSSDEASSDEDA